jgi:hypothetical protein
MGMPSEQSGSPVTETATLMFVLVVVPILMVVLVAGAHRCSL